VKKISKVSPEPVIDVEAPAQQVSSPDEPKEATELNSSNRLECLLELNQDNLIQGIILAEVLGNPKAKRMCGRR
jgi:hypothetical protein